MRPHWRTGPSKGTPSFSAMNLPTSRATPPVIFPSGVRCSRTGVWAFIATRNFPSGAISELIAGCADTPLGIEVAIINLPTTKIAALRQQTSYSWVIPPSSWTHWLHAFRLEHWYGLGRLQEID